MSLHFFSVYGPSCRDDLIILERSAYTSIKILAVCLKLHSRCKFADQALAGFRAVDAKANIQKFSANEKGVWLSKSGPQMRVVHLARLL